jgi:TonB family protein
MQLLLNQISEVKMKTKLFFLITLFLIYFGCKEEKKIEIVTDFDKIYYKFNELDKGPELINDNGDQFILKIFSEYHKIYPGYNTDKSKASLEYKYYINEKGDIEKIYMGPNNNEKINQLVLNTVKNWKFNPGIINGKKVKSQYPMILSETVNIDVKESEYFVAVEEMPSIIGGMKAIQEKIVYPEIAKRAGIEGKVYVLAFIDENGNVANAKILKGVGAGCDEVALDAVKQTKFTPGKQRGTPVKTQVSIPIVFKLQ